ncbi:hypothetical protein Hanom_Chr09g00854181 [Helianthus anomalus]
MILKYMYMLYVYMCVRRFCPLVGWLERPGEAGKDANRGGAKWLEERCRWGMVQSRSLYRVAL